jgi:hypothetical protein
MNEMMVACPGRYISLNAVAAAAAAAGKCHAHYQLNMRRIFLGTCGEKKQRAKRRTWPRNIYQLLDDDGDDQREIDKQKQAARRAESERHCIDIGSALCKVAKKRPSLRLSAGKSDMRAMVGLLVWAMAPCMW